MIQPTRSIVLAIVVTGLAVAACGPEMSGYPADTDTPVPAGSRPAGEGSAETAGSAGSPDVGPRTPTESPVTPGSPSEGPVPSGAPGAGEGGAPDADGGRVSMGDSPLPCEVDKILSTSCRGCHGADPGLLAPMALVTHEDLLAPAPSRPEEPVWQLVRERVHSESAPMPPVGGGRLLLNAELDTLDAWLDGGAVVGDRACPSGGGAPGTISDGKGIIDYTPPGPDEIDECVQLFAHQNSSPGDTTPFQARGGGEYYTAFFWDVPWEGTKQALEYRFNFTGITHHILLYDTTEPASDFQVDGDSSGSHPNAPDLLAAWAVGQQAVQTMPQGVGMHLPTRGSGHRFLVEVHYANIGDATLADRSGVEVCTGKTLRPNTATVSWLGTEAIFVGPGATADIAGTCTPSFGEDIFIFRSFPHMHDQGVALSTSIRRAGGGTETLIDEPFDFNRQVMYDTPAVVRPGDQLLTTCRYQNRTSETLTVGFDSTDEMCFNFVYAWPARALLGGISLTGTATPCLL